MDRDSIKKALDLHRMWVDGLGGGEKADLSSADLSSADLRSADLSSADLSSADLSSADLRSADLSYANLSSADLRSADLSSADLRHADLSSVNGLLSQTQYVIDTFQTTGDGVIVYKQFGLHNAPPIAWNIEPGAVIMEVCNPCRVINCASGINVAKREWAGFDENKPLWRCLIRWPWLAGVIVPYNTDGKIRCEKLELIGTVEE